LQTITLAAVVALLEVEMVVVAVVVVVVVDVGMVVVVAVVVVVVVDVGMVVVVGDVAVVLVVDSVLVVVVVVVVVVFFGAPSGLRKAAGLALPLRIITAAAVTYQPTPEHEASFPHVTPVHTSMPSPHTASPLSLAYYGQHQRVPRKQ
jgi:hypothetical protein